jgi:hypothetical protein
VDSPSNDFEELLGFLNARRAKAVVVGGHALAFHGHPRYTKDLDIFVEPTAENAAAVLQALDDFGFGGVGLTVEDFSPPGKVVQLGVAPNRVDLMTAIDGVSFGDAWTTRVPGTFGAVPVFYLGRDAFLANKRAAGRPQDLADIDALT